MTNSRRSINENNKAKTTSLRMPIELNNHIEEIASKAGVTRTEVILETLQGRSLWVFNAREISVHFVEIQMLLEKASHNPEVEEKINAVTERAMEYLDQLFLKMEENDYGSFESYKL